LCDKGNRTTDKYVNLLEVTQGGHSVGSRVWLAHIAVLVGIHLICNDLKVIYVG
jgi:hypothetical protein